MLIGGLTPAARKTSSPAKILECCLFRTHAIFAQRPKSSATAGKTWDGVRLHSPTIVRQKCTTFPNTRAPCLCVIQRTTPFLSKRHRGGTCAVLFRGIFRGVMISPVPCDQGKTYA